MKNILINCLGIKDSGGIVVFNKLLEEIKTSNQYYFYIICYDISNIHKIVKKYKDIEFIRFIFIKNQIFLYRLYYENIVFKKIILDNNISLIYNFSGTSQVFINIPQILKVHNLTFYSKKVDELYFRKKRYFLWIKQVYLRRVLFLFIFEGTTHTYMYINNLI